MSDFAWLNNGTPITQFDFGRVLAGQNGGPVTLQLQNTSGTDWADLRLSIVQADSDGGSGSAVANGVTLTGTPQSVGPLANGATLDVEVSWSTPEGAPGRAADLAQIQGVYDY